MSTILQVKHLKKIYTTRFGGAQVQALSDVNFSVEAGEYVAIMGESGSGKTTLLNILAALDRPTDGEVLLNGNSLGAIRERDLAAFRRTHLGFVFQDFNLLDTFSLQDNIFLPLVLAGEDYQSMSRKLRPIAEELRLFAEINARGQTIVMVTHSVKAASHAGRVLFLRDGQVYHQLYRGEESQEAQFRRISDTLTVLSQGGEAHA